MVRKKNRLAADARREIKNTFSRYLSILVLSGLAVAFLSGLRASAPNMQYSADRYYDRTNLMDGYVLSTLGITEEDLDALRAADGVAEVEGGRSLDAVAFDCIVTVAALPQRINCLEVKEGRLPQAADECVAESLLLLELGLDIGDTLEVTLPEGEEGLIRTSFTVVGKVTSPLYVGPDRGSSNLGSGSVDGLVYVTGENFDMDVWTAAYFTGEGLLALESYSDEYEERSESLLESLESLAEERAELRYQSVMGEAQAELDEARQELNDVRAEVEQELADAEAELADARRQLDEGWAEYDDGLKTLEQELADAEAELADARKQLDEGWVEYADGRKTLEQELADAEAELADARKQLDEGWTEYHDGLETLERELTDARQTLAAAQAELEQAEKDYQAALEQYQDGLAQYEENLALLDEQQAQVDEGYAQYEAALAPYVGTAYYDMAVSQAAEQKAQLDQAQAQLDEGYGQLAAVKVQLDEAKAQLDEGAETLRSGVEDYEAGLAELNQQEAEGRQALADALSDLEQGEADYADAVTEYEKGKAEAEAELADALADLEQGEQDYADGISEYESNKADAEAELADALVELEDGEAEYADGLAEYEEGKAEAETELADAEQKIADAQAEVDDIEECEWYVLGRETNAGFVSYSQDSERVGNLARIFPIIFFLVAALACLTTMTRMVEEQRTQIGTLKAMGFSRFAISRKYIGYALSASLIGGVLGLALGTTLIPAVIFNAFNIMYSIPDIYFKSQPGMCIVAVLAAVVCTTGAGLWACLSTLMDTPANLMRPKAPKAGRRVLLERVTFLWQRLSFTWKVTMRNLFRYQKRFWMTVIGIGGCTALIVTGFGLHDSIFSILNRQFDDISRYDADVTLDADITAEQWIGIEAYLEQADEVERYLPCRQSAVDASAGGMAYSATLFAVEDQEAFAQFIDLRHRLDDQPVVLDEGGVVITEKLSELLEVGIGDTILLEGDTRVSVEVTDIAENYVMHYIYVSAETYLELFEEEEKDNSVLLAYHDGDVEAESNQVSADLMAMDGVTAYTYIATIRDSFTDSMSAIDYAVVIIILAAAALAFVVLYNLTNINITERIRELATLKVLGFRDGETSAYVYRENIFLTLFGIALGLVGGRFLHSWMVLTVEVDLVMFGRTAPAYAYILAALLTVVFSVLVNVAAHFKLKKVDMVESLKSVE